MAKGLRASSRKKNNTALVARLFGPASDARTERLSAKLQEIAAKPRSDHEKKMDIDTQSDQKQETTETAAQDTDEDMDVDYQITQKAARDSKSDRSNRSRKSRGGKITKKKSKNSVVFPSIIAKQKRQAAARRKI